MVKIGFCHDLFGFYNLNARLNLNCLKISLKVCMILSLYIDAFKYDVSCFACNKYYQIPDDPPDLENSCDSSDVTTRSTQVDGASESNEKLPKKLTLLR